MTSQEKINKLEQKIGIEDISECFGIIIDFELRKNTLNSLIAGAFVVSFVGMLAYLGGYTLPNTLNSVRRDKHNKDLYNQIGITADSKKDEVTTKREWAKIYKELNIPYNPDNYNPLEDIPLTQKENYLKGHK